MKQPVSGRVVIPRNGHVAKMRFLKSGAHKVPGEKSRAQQRQEMKGTVSVISTPAADEFTVFQQRWENSLSETPRILMVSSEDEVEKRARHLNCKAFFLGSVSSQDVFVILDDGEAELFNEICQDFDNSFSGSEERLTW